MRAMILEFPDDPGCDYLDRQYMLGGDLLVAPVFRSDGVVDYYLPAGRWTHFLTGGVVEGGRWVREQHNFFSLPLLARPGAVIAVGANRERPDYDLADGVTFHVFAQCDGAERTVTVPTLEGQAALQLVVRRKGNRLSLRAQGVAKPWRVLLRGVETLKAVMGGSAQEDDLGLLLTPDVGSTELVVTL